MSIKKLLWLIFQFVLVGLIASAIILMANSQINRAKSQQPTFPDTPPVTIPSSSSN